MNWSNKLETLERNKDWESAIVLMQKTISNKSENVEAYIRTIYLLHNILVEEDYPKKNHFFVEKLLKKYFKESKQKFSQNSEYLFFIGKILFISEWYFELDDSHKPLNDQLAFNMQKKAFEKEPENTLYEWAYVFSKNDKKKAFILSKDLLNDKSTVLSWLKTKGFPGEYLIQSLKYCFENYK